MFATTHWSVVVAAGETGSPEGQAALEALCRSYWYPIYVYVRRKGRGAEEAEDLTQDFFTQLIAKEHLRLADPAKGRFRSFLLATLEHFLAREWTRAHRQKRGGQFTFVSLDEEPAENRYREEPANQTPPEAEFLRQWALTVLEQTMNRLERECQSNGKAALFGQVKSALSGEPAGSGYAEVGMKLGMSEGGVKVAVHRLRQRFAELLRSEIAQTVRGPEEVEEELRFLFRALSQ